MIPEWWLRPALDVFITAAIAHLTGSNPVMIVTEQGITYGIQPL